MPPLLEIEGLSMPKLRGGGESIDDCTSATSRGGSVDEEAHDAFEGEGGGRGGGRLMSDTSGLRGGVGRKASMGRSLNATSGDACSNK